MVSEMLLKCCWHLMTMLYITSCQGVAGNYQPYVAVILIPMAWRHRWGMTHQHYMYKVFCQINMYLIGYLMVCFFIMYCYLAYPGIYIYILCIYIYICNILYTHIYI